MLDDVEIIRKQVEGRYNGYDGPNQLLELSGMSFRGLHCEAKGERTESAMLPSCPPRLWGERSTFSGMSEPASSYVVVGIRSHIHY